MNVADFDYHLPDELIAQQPAAQRTGSRLLQVSAQGDLTDGQFPDVLQHLHAGDLLVLNNTRVIPARLFGQKASGGQLELLVERITGEHTALCHIRCSRSPKAGAEIVLENAIAATVTGREGALFDISLDPQKPLLDWLKAYGHMPLPPYIEREDTEADANRYQTVFSAKEGAVAAPTAGLHFDDALLDQVRAKGVRIVQVTLHVGAGTFKPVKVDNIAEHTMHAEWIDVPQATADAINETRANGGRVIALGTTVVRTLESLPQSEFDANKPLAQAWQGDTHIFITPGFHFRFVDALITNFHLPKSTLLMLVSALGGHAPIMRAYQHAVAQQYRFFSYGDAMFIERADNRS